MSWNEEDLHEELWEDDSWDDENEEDEEHGDSWGEEYIEPRPELDDLLRTISMLMGFDNPELPHCETHMCLTLTLLGLVERKFEHDVESYTATQELGQIAQRSKKLKQALKERDEMPGLKEAGFPKIARLLLGKK